jgi:hypothetical protein
VPFQPNREAKVAVMKKLSEAEKQARLVPAKVPPSRRKEVLDRATSMVRGGAPIDFRRDVRR